MSLECRGTWNWWLRQSSSSKGRRQRKERAWRKILRRRFSFFTKFVETPGDLGKCSNWPFFLFSGRKKICLDFLDGKILFPTEQNFVPCGKVQKKKNSVRKKILFRGKNTCSPTPDHKIFLKNHGKNFVPRKGNIRNLSARNKPLFRTEQNFVPRKKCVNLFSGRKIILDLRPFGKISELSSTTYDGRTFWENWLRTPASDFSVVDLARTNSEIEKTQRQPCQLSPASSGPALGHAVVVLGLLEVYRRRGDFHSRASYFFVSSWFPAELAANSFNSA